MNREIATQPTPASIAEYLAKHPAPDLLATDSAGSSRWIHNTTLDGDTLRGVRNHELPPQHMAVPVAQVRSLATAEFSVARTLGLVGGVLAAMTVALLILGHTETVPVN